MFRLSKDTKVVLDCGCGLGDSLQVWKNVFEVAEVVGVNITEGECLAAVNKLSLKEQKQIRVICADAVEFVKFGFEAKSSENSVEDNRDLLQVDSVVVVDSLYHFHTRLAFLKHLVYNGNVRLKKGGRIAAVDMIGTGDLCEEGQLTKLSFYKVLRHPLQYLRLRFICFMAGVPLENMIYSESSLRMWCLRNGYVDFESRDVTPYVLQPFADFTRRKAESKERSFSQRFSLLGASWFMSFLARSGVVRVYLYSMAKPDKD